jgi:hypothetical protein
MCGTESTPPGEADSSFHVQELTAAIGAVNIERGHDQNTAEDYDSDEDAEDSESEQAKIAKAREERIKPVTFFNSKGESVELADAEFDNGAEVNVMRSDFFYTLGFETELKETNVVFKMANTQEEKAVGEVKLVWGPKGKRQKESKFYVARNETRQVRIGGVDIKFYQEKPSRTANVGGVGFHFGSKSKLRKYKE